MITGEQLKTIAALSGVRSVRHHDCGLCGLPTRYVIDRSDVYYDGSCDCAQSRPRHSRWENVAEWINGQTNPEERARILREFGMPEQRYVIDSDAVYCDGIRPEQPIWRGLDRCTWEMIEGTDTTHKTSCGGAFQLPGKATTTPAQVGMRYCCYCGKPILGAIKP
jgi:hypothetical protein